MRNEESDHEVVRDAQVCRGCGSQKLSDVLDIGAHALSGVFLRPGEPDPPRVPLTLCFCDACTLVQLRQTVRPDLLYARYWYRSGTNQTMRDHLRSIVDDVRERVEIGVDDVVVDVGCNDGTLLEQYPNPRPLRIGIDPSDAIDEVRDAGIVRSKGYFSAVAVLPLANGRKVRALTSISMFYDLNDPTAFVRDVANLLTPDGVWVVEMNYTGNMIRNAGYDMISHEHVTYYTIETFGALISREGMFLKDVSFSPINGGSVRLFAGKTPGQTPSVAAALKDETAWKLNTREAYAELAKRIDSFKERFTSYLHSLRRGGATIAVYGASTRGNTLLQSCNLTRETLLFAADRNPAKWGLESAGSRIPIMSEQDVRSLHPTHMLVLPYYFIDEFLRRETDYLNKGGELIVPLPTLRSYVSNDGKISEKVIS